MSSPRQAQQPDAFRQVQDLQDQVDRVNRQVIRQGEIVTTLPSAPFEGQEVSYTPPGDSYAVWRMRWNPANGAWVYTGGAPWQGGLGSSFTINTNNTWNYTAMGGVGFTCPYAGRYQFEGSVLCNPFSGGYDIWQFAITGNTNVGTAGYAGTVVPSMCWGVNDLVRSTKIFAAIFTSTTNNSNFDNSHIRVIPKWLYPIS